MLIKLLIMIFVFSNPFVSLLSNSDKGNFKEEIWTSWQEQNYTLPSAALRTNPNFLPIRNWEIGDPALGAKSAFIFDQEKKQILYQKNAYQVLPIASLTKIMTAIVTLENASINEEIVVSEKALEKGYGERGGLKKEEKLSVKKLLYALLMESSNDAAFVLAEHIEKNQSVDFVNLMNQKAKEIGLASTSFADPSGYQPDNISTANEIAELAQYSFRFPLIWRIFKTTEIDFFSEDEKVHHHWINTDKLLNKLTNVLGGKTGYIQEAGGCLMLVVRQKSGHYFITVVLGSEQRFLETEKLIQWAQQAYQWP